MPAGAPLAPPRRDGAQREAATYMCVFPVSQQAGFTLYAGLISSTTRTRVK
jgi:hypothetical protein